MNREPFNEYNTWHRLLEGDEEAFYSFYNQYYFYLIHIGMKICGDPELVKDSLHDYFMQLWERRTSVGEVRNIRGYIARAYKNTLIHALERLKRLPADNDYGETHSEFRTPAHEETILQNEQQKERDELLTRAIATLPDRQRELLFYRYYLGMTPEQIASKTGLSVRTVYNHIHRAHNHLRTYFSPSQLPDFPGLIIILIPALQAFSEKI